MSTYNVIKLPLWGTEYFKTNDKCIFFTEFAKSNIKYVYDLISDNGQIKSDTQIADSLLNKRNMNSQLYILKRYIIKHLRKLDLTSAPFISKKD